LFAFLKNLGPSSLAISLLIIGATPGTGQSSDIPPPTKPEVISVFPPGGMPGGKIEAEIRGKTLEGAYALWAEDASLNAKITQVEEIQPSPKGKESDSAEDLKGILMQRAIASIEIAPNATIGAHRFRLISPLGVSNSLTFQVVSTSAVADSSAAHNLPIQAQLVSVPAVINGQIDKAANLNYYTFEAHKGQTVKFEIDGIGNLLEVYSRDQSWFDPDRIEKLQPEKNALPGTYRFTKAERYLARVKGDPDSSYQVRIIPVEGTASASAPDNSDPAISADSEWLERSFTRKLTADRLQLLRSRTLAAPPLDFHGAGDSLASAVTASDLTTNPLLEVAEREPNETTDQASEVSIPAILTGAIDRSGDVDIFKFKVKPGEKLAFEIETPEVASPYFNPLIRILNAQGEEVMTNVYKRIPVQSMEYWGTVEPKAIHTFKEGGEYFFQIRDATLQHGEPGFRYRVLIRPQTPHVGEVRVAEVVQHAANDTDIIADRVNLATGYSKKLTVMTEREEGFTGEIAITLDNLPPGVQVIPATEAEGDQVVPHDEGLKQRFRPEIEQVVILLVASENATLTTIPQVVHVTVRPIVPGRVSRWYKTGLSDNVVRVVTQGKIGPSLKVQNFPLMVVKPSEETPELSRIADQSKQPTPESKGAPR
jgi:hypothetical protein